MEEQIEWNDISYELSPAVSSVSGPPVSTEPSEEAELNVLSSTIISGPSCPTECYEIERVFNQQSNLFARITETATNNLPMTEDQIREFKCQIVEFSKLITGAMTKIAKADDTISGIFASNNKPQPSTIDAVSNSNKLLSITDSIEFYRSETGDSASLKQKNKYQMRIVQKPIPHLNVTPSEYLQTFVEVPKYLSEHDRNLLWKYEPITAIDWLEITKPVSIEPYISVTESSKEKFLGEIEVNTCPILKTTSSFDMPTLRILLNMLEKNEDITKLCCDRK